MSAIAGHWSFGRGDLPSPEFAKFLQSQKHRGPDATHITHFPAPRLWLGHCQLVIDQRADCPRQPVTYADGRYWLIYDGEIYNWPELRAELEALAQPFVTESESEVVLAAYARWGPDCLLRFNGGWALAIWDARDRRLFLSRDRFGVKPLHYRIRNGGLSFASELKAFLALDGIDGRFGNAALAATLADLDYQEAGAATLLPGVCRLHAGHAMTVDAAGHTAITGWWHTLDHLPQPARGLREQAEEFRSLFFDACRLRLRGNAPAGIEQSGGLDSSSIACTIAALDRDATACPPQRRRHAFVAGLPSATGENERARLVADHSAMILHEDEVDDRRAASAIEKVVFDHEIVFGFPRVNSWSLYRAMRNAGVRASFNGMGIDDLLGADSDYLEAAFDDAVMRFDLPRIWDLRNSLRGLRGGNVESGRFSLRGELRGLARCALGALRLHGPLARIGRGGQRRIRGWTKDFLRDFPDLPDLRAEAKPSLSTLEAKRFLDFHLVNRLYVANFDRAAMAHGIELRMPFMDWRVVTYCFALPERSRNSAGYTKRVLRMAMRGVVPEPIRQRKSKTAFVAPLDRWAQGALKPWLLDHCADRSFLESAVWDGAAVRAHVEKAVAGDAKLGPAWPVIHAHALERAFVAQAAAWRRAEPAER